MTGCDKKPGSGIRSSGSQSITLRHMPRDRTLCFTACAATFYYSYLIFSYRTSSIRIPLKIVDMDILRLPTEIRLEIYDYLLPDLGALKEIHINLQTMKNDGGKPLGTNTLRRNKDGGFYCKRCGLQRFVELEDSSLGCVTLRLEKPEEIETYSTLPRTCALFRTEMRMVVHSLPPSFYFRVIFSGPCG